MIQSVRCGSLAWKEARLVGFYRPPAQETADDVEMIHEGIGHFTNHKHATCPIVCWESEDAG